MNYLLLVHIIQFYLNRFQLEKEETLIPNLKKQIYGEGTHGEVIINMPALKGLHLRKKQNEGTFRYCMEDCCKEWVDTSTWRPKGVMVLEKCSVEDENIPKPTELDLVR